MDYQRILKKVGVSLFVFIVCFVTIALSRGLENWLNNILQSLVDLATFTIIGLAPIVSLIVFTIILYKFEDIKLVAYKEIKKIECLKDIFEKSESLKYLFKFIALLIYYLIAYSFIKEFLVAEFGSTPGALRYTLTISFALLFLCRFFPEKVLKVNIKTILLTIVFLGFLKRLTIGEIPQLTSPEYETTNLLFLVSLLDWVLIEILQLPNKIFESKKLTSSLEVPH